MVLIIAAAPLETILLRKNMTAVQISRCGEIQLFSGNLEGVNTLLCHPGIGQVNMAIQLTRLLSSYQPDAVLLCGCGGSYPASGLKNGDLALATTETFSDLGVSTDNRFIPLEQLDLPQDRQLAPPVKQTFTLNPQLLQYAQKILPQADSGPFSTVNSCSGTSVLSIELERRSGAICENMEGAAAAQVCENFGLPLLELRGISNPTGTRDPQQWDIVCGAEAAQYGILTLLKSWVSN